VSDERAHNRADPGWYQVCAFPPEISCSALLGPEGYQEIALDVYEGLFTEDLEELADRLQEKYR
jgi:hypothetical protein